MIISEISDFKKDQLRYELRNEPANNFAIYIDGKKWKVFKGEGFNADDAREERQFTRLKNLCKRKSFETGKDWQVGKTGEEPTAEAKQAKASDPKPKLIKPNKGHESRNVTRGKLVGEADEPKADVSARAKLDHSLRAQGHKVVPDKKKEFKKGKVKHKGKIEEGPLVLNRDSDLRGMLDTLLKSWLAKGDRSDKEYAELLKALGYKMQKDGQRTTLVKAVQGAIQN